MIVLTCPGSGSESGRRKKLVNRPLCTKAAASPPPYNAAAACGLSTAGGIVSGTRAGPVTVKFKAGGSPTVIAKTVLPLPRAAPSASSSGPHQCVNSQSSAARSSSTLSETDPSSSWGDSQSSTYSSAGSDEDPNLARASKMKIPELSGEPSPEELHMLRGQVPVDEDGKATSIGSVDHHTGRCKPCLFVHTNIGCQKSHACQFCHFVHKRKNKSRPCKGKRDRYKKLISRMEQMAECAPDGVEDESSGGTAEGEGSSGSCPSSGDVRSI